MFGKPLSMTGQCSQQLHEVCKNFKICYLWVNIFTTIISTFGIGYHLHFQAEIKYSVTMEESALHFNFSYLNTSKKYFLWSLRWTITSSNMHFINIIIYRSERLLAISWWYLPYFLFKGEWESSLWGLSATHSLLRFISNMFMLGFWIKLTCLLKLALKMFTLKIEFIKYWKSCKIGTSVSRDSFLSTSLWRLNHPFLYFSINKGGISYDSTKYIII